MKRNRYPLTIVYMIGWYTKQLNWEKRNLINGVITERKQFLTLSCHRLHQNWTEFKNDAATKPVYYLRMTINHTVLTNIDPVLKTKLICYQPLWTFTQTHFNFFSHDSKQRITRFYFIRYFDIEFSLTRFFSLNVYKVKAQRKNLKPWKFRLFCKNSK